MQRNQWKWLLWTTPALLAVVGRGLQAADIEQPAEEAPDAPLEASHQQIGIIQLDVKGEEPSNLNTFCLVPDGRVFTAWGGMQTEYVEENGELKVKTTHRAAMIRVFSGDGELLTTWKLDMTPQMLNVGPDGHVYAAGYGKLIKLNADGEVVARADTPHAKAVEENAEELKEKHRKVLAANAERYVELLEQARQRVAELEEKDEADRTAADKRRLRAAQSQVETYEQMVEQQDELQDRQTEMMLINKKAVRGIAVTDQDIFVSTPAIEGFGYDVWRMDHNFQNPKQIITGLSGCCGNMDIQANNGELYVAENSRHRVCRYNRDGELLASFGRADRKGDAPDGFSGCCNPMNLRFGPNGDVYTAESTLGRIKRFSPDGEFLGVVGTVKLVPGCKHVAIAVGQDGDRVYMLDITRNQIVVMGRKDGADEPTKVSLRADRKTEVQE